MGSFCSLKFSDMVGLDGPVFAPVVQAYKDNPITVA